MKKYSVTIERSFLNILVGICFLLVAGEIALAHPFGGILQKTVVSDLGNTFLLEYTTHFGPEQVLLLNPDKDKNGQLDALEKGAFLDAAVQRLTPNISCRLNDQPLEMIPVDKKLVLEDANDYKNGLNSTLVFHIPLGREASPGGIFRISDNNFRAGEMSRLNYFVTVLGRTGPMVLAGEGRELLIDLSAKYGETTGLPVETEEHGDAALAGVDAGTQPSEADEAGSLIDFLKEKNGGPGLYLIGLLTAFVLGAFHALSPGHGKAMVAAYLVGTRGRVVDAVRLGIVVTITHIFSVLVLGVIALVLSQYSLSRDFYPWLGLASGVLIMFTGYLLLARTALSAGQAHSHSHDGHHDDHNHDHHSHHDHSHVPAGNSLGEILSLGIAGGLVPCPSAIVILLFAIAVNRIATGLLLIVSFSLGLAVVLIAIGIFMVKASSRMEQVGKSVGWIRKLPIFTAGIIMVLGLGVALKALIDGGILIINL